MESRLIVGGRVSLAAGEEALAAGTAEDPPGSQRYSGLYFIFDVHEQCTMYMYMYIVYQVTFIHAGP